jgi:hypothetical protein
MHKRVGFTPFISKHTHWAHESSLAALQAEQNMKAISSWTLMGK